MLCGLALTGSGPPTWVWVVAVALLAAGVILLMVRRRTRASIAVGLLVILALGAVGVVGSSAPAQAADGCTTTAANSLTITQTSTMSGLMPGTSPAPIAGLVTNNGPDATDIVAIVVSVSSVTKAPGAPAGACSAADYILLDPAMPVGATLGPGASATFGGASIGFRSTAANQNACKGASVNLLYSTTP